MYNSNKRRKISHDVNLKKRKNDFSLDIDNVNKKIRLLNLNINYVDFKNNYTEFTYDLSSGINLRIININIFGRYLERINTNIFEIIRNSKYLSKYEKFIENGNMIVNEEDLWCFFEYELKY